MKNALYSLFGVVAGFILAGVLFYVSRAPAGVPIVLQPAPTQAPIAVQVSGAVARPGLYKFSEGARTQDAIDAAGGLLTTANTDALNLAAKVEDGQQLDIPFQGDSNSVAANPTLTLPGATQSPANTPNPDLLDINTATLQELETLPGIGAVTAQNIIDYRDENGDFCVPEDLLDVSGIGDTTLNNIIDLITVSCE